MGGWLLVLCLLLAVPDLVIGGLLAFLHPGILALWLTANLMGAIVAAIVVSRLLRVRSGLRED